MNRVERVIITEDGTFLENPAADIINKYHADMERMNQNTMMMLDNYKMLEDVRKKEIYYPRVYNDCSPEFVKWENNYLKKLLKH